MADTILCASGIYAVRNTVNGKMYIGSAAYIARRKSQHLHALRMGKHHTQALQSAWEKYGPDAFVFETLELVPDLESLIRKEQAWIDEVGSVAPGGYNIRAIAESCKGIKHRPEVVEANRLRGLGKKQSAETIEKRRLSRLGRKLSEETKRKISLANKGKVFGPQPAERRSKTSAALTGMRKTDEWRSNLSRSHASLTDDQVRAARSMRQTGMAIPQIAASMNVPRAVIANVCAMRSYKYVA